MNKVEQLEKEIKNLREREEAFRKQRQERGWDDSELWSLDNTIARFVYPRLKEFRKRAAGHPGDITQKEWENILDKMLFAIKFSKNQYKDKYFQKEVKMSIEEIKERNQRVQEGLELFGKYFLHLWW